MDNINEQVSVNLRDSLPTEFLWHQRNYSIENVGLHHTVREGRTLIHVFSVTSGGTFFRLQFNTETLLWQLTHVQSS